VADTPSPKVSIIVAAYNSQDTIEECLKSILSLNYPSGFYEVIVMDGGSKDSTVKIAEHFPIKVVSIRLNAPAAYNYAMKIATHPILGFIDADRNMELSESMGKEHRIRAQKPLQANRKIYWSHRNNEFAPQESRYRGSRRMGRETAKPIRH
jgi:hypothetical protein